MIYGNVNEARDYGFLDEQVIECMEYLKNHKLLDYDTGRYDIDGDRLFVNVVEYTTKTPEERFWEAHKDYLDIHVMLRGEEQIDLAFVDQMQCEEYVPERDFLPMNGEKCAHVTLKEGDFLVCFPKDAHRTAVAVGKPEDIKKLIFKARIPETA